ncbi:MAG TPA: VOC family protein [Thermoplasmata archaeon]|nr:VOC family protein [Thermoplasmata archaeon]
MPLPKVEFVYSGLRVRDLGASLRFFRRLGFAIHKRGTMEHGGRWVQLGYPGTTHRLELNFYPKGSRFYETIRKGTEFDHLGFRVADVAAWETELRRRRIPIVARIRETHENLLYVRDPDGNWIEYFGPVPKDIVELAQS